MKTRYAEFKAGIIVIAASVVLLGLLFFATGGKMFRKSSWLEFRIEEGFLAPRKGDPVYMNGKQIGTVEEVRWKTEIRQGDELTPADRKALRSLLPDPEHGGLPADARAREVYLSVLAEIYGDQTLPVGTMGVIAESLTGQRTLQLVPGRSTEDIPLADDRDGTPPRIFVAQAADLTTLAEKLEGVADDVTLTLSGLRQNLDKVGRTLDKAHDTIAKFETRLLDGGQLERTLANVEAASGSLKRSMETLEPRVASVMEKADEAVADFRRLAGTGARMVDGMEGKVAGILEDVKRTTGRLDEIFKEANPRLQAVLEDAGTVGKNLVTLSEDLAATGPKVRAIVEGSAGDVDALLESLLETGQNLADASEDIRAHPWKLLNEPSEDEIAYENLRNAMLNYVRAMNRVDRSSRTVADLLARSEADADTQALLARALAQLEGSLERYEYFETRLMELLQKNQVPAAAVSSEPPPTVRPR